MYDCALPFPRGSTYGNMGDKTMTAALAVATGLAGRVFEVPDTVHGTGKTIKLRVVANETGADLTVGRKGLGFGPVTAAGFGQIVVTAPGVGGIGKPIDDGYVKGKTIPHHDLFYVLESGPCYILTTSNGAVALEGGWPVSFDDEGRLGTAKSAAGYYVIGAILETTILNSAEVTVDVAEGLVPANA